MSFVLKRWKNQKLAIFNFEEPDSHSIMFRKVKEWIITAVSDKIISIVDV
jgi:hypothetical protein